MRRVVPHVTLMSDFSDIFETFELLGDWDARYQYLVELGEQMEPMPAVEKTEGNRVKPCMSTVHVVAYWDGDDPDVVRYRGDCDTAIIKGVVSLLVGLMSDKTVQQILELDLDRLFAGAATLSGMLSSTRTMCVPRRRTMWDA